jgi:16S rRNA (guanine527-N7)-methyltransferase
MISSDSLDRRHVLGELNVSRETSARLDSYVELLFRWQRMMNLVSPTTMPVIWSRHIWDSAQLLDFTPPDIRRWVDLGSGGGLPGLVIAALTSDRIGFEMILIEADQRKAQFLRTAAREMGLVDRVEVIAARIEKAMPNVAPGDVISARALAPLPDLVRWSLPHLRAGALGVFPKGETAQAELTQWGPPDTFDVTLASSRTHPSASIALVRMRAS